MDITRAVVTAAGPTQRRLPLQRFVALDGSEKTAIQIIIEELVAADIEEIAIVIHPGDQAAYSEAAGPLARSLTFIEQPEPRGYGAAIHCARDFIAGEPFLHLVSDHLYISHEARPCARQLIEIARQEQCAVAAVQPTRESMLPYFGAVGGRRVRGRSDLYEIDSVLEKPTPTEAEQRLVVPGLRAGFYLCLFGMHVLTPTVMDMLGEALAATPAGPIALSPTLARLAARERYLALELAGSRFNVGVKYGTLFAQLAVALGGCDRDEILVRLVELLAGRQSPKA